MTSLVVTDAVPAAIRSVVDKYGPGNAVEAVDSPEKLLASGVDGVVVAAATDAHPELIVAAVEAGVPVFCEKPVAKTMTEGVAVARRVAGSGVPIQIGYPRRFDAGFAAVRQAIASGELGWVHTVRSTTLDPAPPPAAYLAVSGGIFRDCSIHDFDAVRFVTGREVVRVYAVGENRGEAFFAESGDVDAAAAVLTLDDGTTAVVSGSRYNARGYDVRLELLGSKDSVCVGMDDRLPLRSLEAGVDFPSARPYADFMERFHQAYVDEMVAFAELVAGRIETPCSVQDALQAFLVAEACNLSRREGRPVHMDEIGR